MKDNLIRLTFGGDVMAFASENEARLARYGKYDYSDYLSYLKPLCVDSDYVCANLETPVAPSMPFTARAAEFNSPPELLVALKDVGFSFLSTANNHCLDRNIDGLKETLTQLVDFGFDHDGTFSSVEDAGRLFIKSICGANGKCCKIAIVACTFGTNSQHNGNMLSPENEWCVALTRRQLKKKNIGFNPDVGKPCQYEYIVDDVSPAAIGNPIHQIYLDKVLSKIRQAKMEADIVIAMPHVGGQYNPAPGMYAKYIFRELKSAGADMIVGGHPHVSQRSEKRGTSFYTYSLGNLCFTPGIGYYIPNTLADYGIVLHAYFDSELFKLQKVTFDVVKSIKCADGLTRVMPVTDIYAAETNLSRRERLEMENEAVVNRFRGTGGSIAISKEYPF